MARPLTGRREVFRRLEERNEARRVRTNEVREMGGLEPLQNSQELPENMYYTGTELEDYLSRLNSYVGTPNIAYYQRQLAEAVISSEPIRLYAGRTMGGRSSFNLAHSTAYAMASDTSLRGQGAQYIYLDTEATFPRVRFDELYTTSNPCNEIHLDEFSILEGDWWALLNGKITEEEYQKRQKLQKLKKEKEVTNNKASFVLEKEY